MIIHLLFHASLQCEVTETSPDLSFELCRPAKEIWLLDYSCGSTICFQCLVVNQILIRSPETWFCRWLRGNFLKLFSTIIIVCVNIVPFLLFMKLNNFVVLAAEFYPCQRLVLF